MRKNIIREPITNIALLLFSSLLVMIANPNIFNSGVGLVIFVALIPAFYVLKKSTYITSFIYGFIYGILYYVFLNYWLKTFHPLAIVIVPILRGVQYGFLFLILHIVDKSFNRYKNIMLSLTYTAYMFVLEQGFLGYSYGNVAYALYKHILLIQCVDLIGIWPLVFLIVLPGFIVINDKKLKKIEIVVFFALFTFVILYGVLRLNQKNKSNEEYKTINLLVVQHNENSHINGFDSYVSSFNTLKSLTDEGLKEHPNTDLVVWSETAFVPPIFWHQNYRTDLGSSILVDALVSYSFNLDYPILLGNGDARIIDNKKTPSFENAYYYNASVLLNKGNIENVYRKNHLVPFTEYFPYQNEFPHFYAFLLSKNFNFWTKGDRFTLFDIKKGDDTFKFYTPICFEDTFGYLSRNGVKNGAEFLINLTNDSWSGTRVAEEQHLSAAVFRSVENNIPTVRSTNSGVSCLIKPNGKIENKLPYFEKAYGFYSVDIYNHKNTLYTIVGDMPIKIICVLVLFLVVFQNALNCVHYFSNRRTRR